VDIDPDQEGGQIAFFVFQVLQNCIFISLKCPSFKKVENRAVQKSHQSSIRRLVGRLNKQAVFKLRTKQSKIFEVG
jgi:hypothetical protein